jgi:uroporphyrinogen-III synthase
MKKTSDSLGKPLAGLRVLVTRAEGRQSETFADKLESLGAIVCVIPLLVIAEPDSWTDLDRAITDLADFHWVIFASTNAAECFFSRLRLLKAGLDPACTRIAAIGSATARALIDQGALVSFQPDVFIAEELVKNFPGYPNLGGTRILWPKTNIGRLLIAEGLTASGASVKIVDCYKTTAPSDLQTRGANIASLLRSKQLDAITLASAQTARHLAQSLQDEVDAQSLFEHCSVVAIGPETSNAFRAYFPGVAVEQSSEFTVDGIIESLSRLNRRS